MEEAPKANLTPGRRVPAAEDEKEEGGKACHLARCSVMSHESKFRSKPDAKEGALFRGE